MTSKQPFVVVVLHKPRSAKWLTPVGEELMQVYLVVFLDWPQLR